MPLDPESMERLCELGKRTPPPKPHLVSYAGGVGESRKLLSEWLRTSEDVLVENVHRREPDTEQYCGCCWRFERGEWTQVAVCVDHYTPVTTAPGMTRTSSSSTAASSTGEPRSEER